MRDHGVQRLQRVVGVQESQDRGAGDVSVASGVSASRRVDDRGHNRKDPTLFGIIDDRVDNLRGGIGEITLIVVIVADGAR